MPLSHAFSYNMFLFQYFYFLFYPCLGEEEGFEVLWFFFSSNTPLAARQPEGASFYKNYIFNGKKKKNVMVGYGRVVASNVGAAAVDGPEMRGAADDRGQR